MGPPFLGVVAFALNAAACPTGGRPLPDFRTCHAAARCRCRAPRSSSRCRRRRAAGNVDGCRRRPFDSVRAAHQLPACRWRRAGLWRPSGKSRLPMRPCDQTLDFQIPLAPRRPEPASPPQPAPAPEGPRSSPRGSSPTSITPTHAGENPRQRRAAVARRGGANQSRQRFQTLTVQADTNASGAGRGRAGSKATRTSRTRCRRAFRHRTRQAEAIWRSPATAARPALTAD